MWQSPPLVSRSLQPNATRPRSRAPSIRIMPLDVEAPASLQFPSEVLSEGRTTDSLLPGTDASCPGDILSPSKLHAACEATMRVPAGQVATLRQPPLLPVTPHSKSTGGFCNRTPLADGGHRRRSWRAFGSISVFRAGPGTRRYFRHSAEFFLASSR